MRKTLLGATGAAALLCGSFTLPAVASAPVPVDGDHFSRAGLTHVTHGCTDESAEPPTDPEVLVKAGPKHPPIGKQSLGWDMQGQTTYGAGVLAHTSDATRLKHASIATYFVGGSGQGSAYAVYQAPGDAGVWHGVASLPVDSTRGWHRVDVGHVDFAWTHFNQGIQDGTGPAMTLADQATLHGGNRDGAEVGVLFGCTGETFYVDDLRLVTGKKKVTYDLGGYRTVSDIVWGSVVQKKITITYGQRLGLTGRLRAKFDYTRLSGALNVQAKPSGARKWRKVDHVAAGGDFKVAPARTTEYRTVFAGNKTYRASQPKLLTVRVHSVVKAGLADASVTKGHAFTVRGRVLPGHAAKLRLQRYAHKHWRTAKKGKASRDGRFHLSMPARTTGTSYWRVVAAAGGGNLGNHSHQMKLKVSAPHHHTSGGGGGTSAPPPADPPPPPTEPPPPTH